MSTAKEKEIVHGLAKRWIDNCGFDHYYDRWLARFEKEGTGKNIREQVLNALYSGTAYGDRGGGWCSTVNHFAMTVLELDGADCIVEHFWIERHLVEHVDVPEMMCRYCDNTLVQKEREGDVDKLRQMVDDLRKEVTRLRNIESEAAGILRTVHNYLNRQQGQGERAKW